ncbi:MULTISPECIES: Trk system potassium transporter TrkA [Pseudomonas]|jgi:trk system potassium uptake protein TrkA|uniref:Trk system potassium uptake protein TrkA n=1 Tax=Pseudomonas psychrophila TaxID=122355 RepID=A0A8I1FTG4_9PSED|nr:MULTISPECIES: Trk system potassium transporter TrkA [Pseudomonas]EPJ91565.1 potassium transporter peripheral membrane component [Pseudomonas psychrophila]KAB0485211.1 Trk system potassium transporter TrkA [Pseudomonas psychrophila]KMM97032.1 potassium transporter peripheral membrane component [Pseudomonas psychrophila]KOX65252.1 potassium transporter peripheral membrane component [Pseudomonas psychrophila]MBJ2256775.1 Trk system potassium transporter TrkA [Pseudomonas psychrophila]
MKIIILGAGQVGGTLAEHLASEANDITVVDTDGERLRDLGDRLDIRTVQGRASLPNVLRQAGADDADMLVAVTNSDETNMVACQVAYTLFHTPTKIARVREAAYLTRGQELFDNDAIPVDVLISPEQVVTNYIKRLIEHPGALQVIDFAEGKAQLVAVKAYYGGPLIGQQLRQLREHMPNVDTRVAAIFRRDRPITPRGDTVIEADDEVFFIAAKANIRAVMSEMRRLDESYKRIVIAGGGQIGERLAEAIESRYQVKIIEMNPARCRYLSDTLDSTVVLQGSASDRDLMLEENIADADVFLALTNDDEANIMSSLLAKRLGAKKVMTIINNPAYVDLIQGGEIDIAISPQLATIGTLLAHVRRGDIVSVHSLRRGAAEAIEAIAHGDSRSSKVIGRSIGEINLPPGTTIGAIIRDEEVLIAHDSTVINAGDHVILFLVDKKHIRDVEKLFHVGLSFF